MSDAIHSTVVPASPHHSQLHHVNLPITTGTSVTYIQPSTQEDLERLRQVVEEHQRNHPMMSLPARRGPSLHPTVAALMNALLAPQGIAQQIAVAVLLGDTDALPMLIDAAKDEGLVP